jgi:hypothetical protein
VIAWDTETRSLRWWENPAFMATWDVGQGGQLALLPPHVSYARHAGFVDALEGEQHHVLANAKFDEADQAIVQLHAETLAAGNVQTEDYDAPVEATDAPSLA